MRLQTRTRLVVSTVLPCFVIVGLLSMAFLRSWNKDLEDDLHSRGELLGENLAVALGDIRAAQATAVLTEQSTRFDWVGCLCLMDAYGQVLARDESADAMAGILHHDPAVRKHITQIQDLLFLPKTFEVFVPLVDAAGERCILRVGLDRGTARRRVMGAARWLAGAWLFSLVVAFLGSMLFSRIALERSVSSLSNLVLRLADRREGSDLSHSEMEPALGPLVESLRRLFRSIREDRAELALLRRDVSEKQGQVSHLRSHSEHATQERDSEIRRLHREIALLLDEWPTGVVRVDHVRNQITANRRAKQWLSLGLSPGLGDLPLGLVRCIEQAKGTSGESPIQCSFVTRHPLFGHERSLEAVSLSMGEEEGGQKLRTLILLKEKASEPAPPPKSRVSFSPYLEALRSEIVALGKRVHSSLSGKEDGPDQTDPRAALEDLGYLVRDLDVLRALEAVGRPRSAESHIGHTEGQELQAILSKAAQRLDMPEPKLGHPPAGVRQPAPGFTLLIEPGDLEVVLRESLALLAGLAGASEVVFGIGESAGSIVLELIPAEGSGTGEPLGKQLVDLLQGKRKRGTRNGFAKLRFELVAEILGQHGGKVQFDRDSRGLILRIPGKVPTKESANDSVGGLTRAFFGLAIPPARLDEGGLRGD